MRLPWLADMVSRTPPLADSQDKSIRFKWNFSLSFLTYHDSHFGYGLPAWGFLSSAHRVDLISLIRNIQLKIII